MADLSPVLTRKGGLCKIKFPRPEQCLGGENDEIFGKGGCCGKRTHVKVGGNNAQEIRSLIEGGCQKHFWSKRRVLHITTQGVAFLFCVFVEQRNVVKFLQGCLRFLSENRAVVLHPCYPVHPGKGLEKRLNPCIGRGLVGVHHDALKFLKLKINAEHGLRELQGTTGERTCIIVVNGGGRTGIRVPESLGALPHLFCRLIGSASC